MLQSRNSPADNFNLLGYNTPITTQGCAMAEGHNIPNPFSRIIEMMTGGDKNAQSTASIVTGMGGALAAAGVAYGGVAASAAALGSLSVDPGLPNLVASMGQGRGGVA